MINQEIIDFANNLADLSAPIAKKYFRNHDNGEIQKSDQSPVTKADQEIEAMIRAQITQKFPEHGVIGEEYDDTNVSADYKWIIDPIDGTSSFIMGRPTFGTLIALSYKNKAVLGIVNQPITNERWLGIDDGSDKSGAWLNGVSIKSRNCTEIPDAVLSTTSPFFFDLSNTTDKFEKLSKAAKYQRFGGVIYGGDCYAYALLATGFVDIIIEPDLKIYDFAALIPIIKQAGGFMGDWEGSEIKLESNAKLLACSTKKLYDKVVDLIK